MRISVMVFGAFLLSLSLGASFAQNPPRLVSAPNIIPPATEAMQHPEYWIARIGPDADKVIMTPEQIRALNLKNRTRPLEMKDINGDPFSIRNLAEKREFYNIQFYPQDPLMLKPFPGDSLRIGLKKIHDYVAGRKFIDRRRIPFPDEVIKEILEAIDENAVPSMVKPRYSVIVGNASVRHAPYAQRGYSSQDTYLDMLAMAALEAGSPVAVLHTSKNGDWYYVRAEYLYGWVRAEQVAFGPVQEIRRFSEPEPFIVSLPHSVPVYGNKECTVFLTDMYQGTRFRLVNKSSSGYKVLAPFRRADGRLEAVTGWLKPDADVSAGYQPFTQRNVINTMFRLLYRPYGWQDSENERDCCGILRTVLRTFGIFTPRGTIHELHNTDHVYAFPKGTSKEVKYKYLDTCEPGITLCGFSGHIVLYLGKVDGVSYVIHSNGYSYHDKDGTEIRIGRVDVNDTEMEGGSNIGGFTEISTIKP